MVASKKTGPYADSAEFETAHRAELVDTYTAIFDSDESAEAYGRFFPAASSYGRRRRRRGSNKGGSKVLSEALQQKQQKHQQKQQQQKEARVMERVLELLNQQDVVGCGMKLICELAGFREEDLTEEQFTILNLIEPRTKPGEGLLPSSRAATDYKEAKTLGQNHLSCSLNFPQCPLNATQLMDLIDAYVP